MRIRSLWLCAPLVLLLAVPAHSASTAACTQLANGASQDITVGGICRKVTNNSGRTICALTGNATMWNSYITKTVPGVAFTACGGPPPPPPDCGAGPGSCNFVNSCGESFCIANGNFTFDPWEACRPRYRCDNGSLTFVTNLDPMCSAPPMCP